MDHFPEKKQIVTITQKKKFASIKEKECKKFPRIIFLEDLNCKILNLSQTTFNLLTCSLELKRKSNKNILFKGNWRA